MLCAITLGEISISYAQIKTVLLWIFIGSGIIEWIPPIKIRPYSWLLHNLGDALNHKIYEDIVDIKNDVEKLQQKIDALEEKDQEIQEKNRLQLALASRRRILSTADNLRRNYKLSEESFNEILQDIKDYKHYCEENPTFKNERAVVATDVIKKKYQYCIEHDDFL